MTVFNAFCHSKPTNIAQSSHFLLFMLNGNKFMSIVIKQIKHLFILLTINTKEQIKNNQRNIQKVTKGNRNKSTKYSVKLKKGLDFMLAICIKRLQEIRLSRSFGVLFFEWPKHTRAK